MRDVLRVVRHEIQIHDDIDTEAYLRSILTDCKRLICCERIAIIPPPLPVFVMLEQAITEQRNLGASVEPTHLLSPQNHLQTFGR